MRKIEGRQKVGLDELKKMAHSRHGDYVKAVLDISKQVMVIDVEWHVEAQEELLQQGSRRQHLWGIRLHPSEYGSKGFIEYNAATNIQPELGNPRRTVEDRRIQRKIEKIVAKFVQD